MIETILDNNQEIETMHTLPIRELFDDLQSAHNALVEFARSGGKPGGAAGLAAQVEVFTERAKMVSGLVQSFRKDR
jgi:hypothetical protein